MQKAYEKSDVYLTMSEHEGFGIPILEAAIYGPSIRVLPRSI